MNILNIGIIGTGNIAEIHIESYLKNPQTNLYALCDINEERLNEMGEKYGIPAERRFTSRADMLSLPELDAVSVCTWNAAHAVCTIDALQAGKHVLCEKPMATSAEEAREMLQAAKKSGKLLMIGFVRRYGDDCKILQDFINNDFFGELYYAKASYLRRYGNPEGWFSNKSYSAGGPLIDLGVHVIDLVRYLADRPKPVSVYGATFRKLEDRNGIKDSKAYVAASAKYMEHVFDVEDLATAMIRFDNGLVLSVEASFTLNLKEDKGEVELFGTKAGAKLGSELELFNETNGYMTNMTLASKEAFTFGDMFAHEIAHFTDCILHDVPCKSPAEDGVEMMRILDAIYESAATGHEVIL